MIDSWESDTGKGYQCISIKIDLPDQMVFVGM